MEKLTADLPPTYLRHIAHIYGRTGETADFVGNTKQMRQIRTDCEKIAVHHGRRATTDGRLEIIGNRRATVRNSYDRPATIRKIYDRRKLIKIALCDRPTTDSRQMCDSLPTVFWQKMGIFTADLRQILTASPSADLRRKRGFFRTFYEWHFLPFCELYGKI